VSDNLPPGSTNHVRHFSCSLFWSPLLCVAHHLSSCDSKIIHGFSLEIRQIVPCRFPSAATRLLLSTAARRTRSCGCACGANGGLGYLRLVILLSPASFYGLGSPRTRKGSKSPSIDSDTVAESEMDLLLSLSNQCRTMPSLASFEPLNPQSMPVRLPDGG
jgi:hypothetical protein